LNTYQRNFIPRISNRIWKEKRIINSKGNITTGSGDFIGYGKIEFDDKGAWLQNRKLPRASKKRTSLC
jgi:hypothetical protein